MMMPTNAKSQRALDHKKANPLFSGILCLLSLASMIFFPLAYFKVAELTVRPSAAAQNVSAALNALNVSNTPTAPPIPLPSSGDAGTWTVWYRSMGYTSLAGMGLSFLLACTGICGAMALAGTNGNEAVVGIFGMVAMCETCLVVPLLCFACVWGIWGFIMFCNSGWTSFSKWYLILIMIQWVYTCVYGAIQKKAMPDDDGLDGLQDADEELE